ncbi:DUF2206 domain-containing protein, partial [Thermococcus sp. GR7]|uniref:DUF2206 domain-containing protein n=1 Tax=Thermococcus sp. GR7 TaxID=1638257 RepID=UPI00142FC47B
YDLFDPYSSQGLYLIVSERSTITQQFVKFVGLVAQAFIVLGIVYTVINLVSKVLKKTKIFHLEFYAVSLVFFLYDVFGVILPFFSNRLNVTRLYHLTLFFISPYLIIGFLQFIQLILKGVRSLLNSLDLGRIPVKRYLALFIVIYFLSTSRWLYTITGDEEIYLLSKN